MSEEERRPDPDRLLRSVTRDGSRAERGRLRVFLGMCPGVGKTYAMLLAAREKVKTGLPVLVGIVETHRRQETEALLEGLSVLPRRSVDYRGRQFQELDLDAVLTLRPKLVLLDELAHTNVPGSRHPKRYQDVQEILEAGIDVYTTINVQHIESRVDLVKQITGVTVQESVPDGFFELADQVELIDLPPAELLKRLQEGKVYLGETAQRAAASFFREEHLLALRELALRFVAEVVEGELHEQMLRKQISGPWQTRERLLVAVSHSPYSRRLIRAARRMAAGRELPWIALSIDDGSALTDEDQSSLRRNLDMARDLGAELVSVRDADVPSAIRRTAEERNVTQILMGRPDRRFFRDLIRGGTILDKLVRETSEVDVHVLRQVRKPKFRGFRPQWPRFGGTLSEYYYAGWTIVAVTGLGVASEPLLKYQAVGFLYLLGILAIASFAERGPALLAASASALAWNYFFIPPKFTFYIREIADVMMCVAYFAVAAAASLLTTKIRRQSRELSARAGQMTRLFDFSRELTRAADETEIVKVASLFVERTVGGACTVLLRDGAGKLVEQSHTVSGVPLSVRHLAVAAWVNSNERRAGFGTETLSGSDVFCLPVRGGVGTLGVLLFFPRGKSTIALEDERTLESVCASVAIAVERERLHKSVAAFRINEESHKLYQTILDSVSHELRTPITALLGAANTLQDPRAVEHRDYRLLIAEMAKGARRLSQVVENLLDTSRMSAGPLPLRLELMELGEVVESAIAEWGVDAEEAGRVRSTIESGVLVECDARWFSNAIKNLLRNAADYSPPESEIQVNVARDVAKGQAVLEVADRGPGIDAAERDKVFQKFYRLPGTPSGGLGLGLSIVKSIVEYHRGRIEVAERANLPGSVLRIRLPLWTGHVPEAP